MGLLSAAPALAFPPSGEVGSEDRAIVVTGTRLRQDRSAQNGEIVAYDASDLRLSGATSIGDFLSTTPYVQGQGFGPASNAARGTSTLNLRGLGAARTLVLVNGRRVVATNNLAASLTVDLNNIPPGMIERVDILRGGASSIYGSDAIAGVVNVVLRSRAEGLSASVQSGFTARGDGRTFDGGLVWGSSLGSGHVVASVGYTDRDEIFGGDRPLFEHFLQEVGNPPTIVFGGSGNSGMPRADALIIPGLNQPARPFTIADTFNTAPLTYLQTPQRRFTATALADYQLSPAVRLFGEFGFVRRESVSFLGPFPVVVGPNELGGRLRELIRANPFNTFPNGQTLGTFQRRFVEAGPRFFRQEAMMWRGVAGLDGDVDLAGSPWRLEISYAYGRSRVDETISGRPNFARLAEALDPATCSPAATPPPGVAPCANLFFPGSLRPVDVAWITYVDHADMSVREHVATAFASGTVYPIRDVAVDLAVGGEYRRERVEDNPDPITVAGLTAAAKGIRPAAVMM
jgi:iron complex outermembrane receptor protein